MSNTTSHSQVRGDLIAWVTPELCREHGKCAVLALLLALALALALALVLVLVLVLCLSCAH